MNGVSPMRALQEESDSSVATIATSSQARHGYSTALFTDEAAAFHWLAA